MFIRTELVYRGITEELVPKTDQGITDERYLLIPRTLIFLLRGTQILLLKGAPDKRLWANCFNGVGGHVERGEDILTAAKRELKEETGLESGDLRLCGTVVIDAGEPIGVGIYIFCGNYSGGEFIESAEGALQWVEKAVIYNLPLVEDLKSILPRVLDFQVGDAPFSARYYYDEADKLKITFGVS